MSGESDRRRLVFGLSLAEDVLYAAVALVLVGVAVALLYHTIEEVFTAEHLSFVRRINGAVNGVLFVALVALVLVIALVLIRRSPSGADDGDMLD